MGSLQSGSGPVLQNTVGSGPLMDWRGGQQPTTRAATRYPALQPAPQQAQQQQSFFTPTPGGVIQTGGNGPLGGPAPAPASAGVPAAAPVSTPVSAPPNAQSVRANPQMMQVYNAMLQRAGQGPTQDPLLAEQVQNLRRRLSTDTTQRAIQGASNAITDANAAKIQAARERAAAQGTGSNMEPTLNALNESAQRQQAGAARDIELGRQSQLDQLVLGGQGIMSAPGQRELTQQGMSNALLQGAGGMAGGIAQNQLGVGGLNLQQWQAQQQALLGNRSLDIQQQQAQQAQANQQANQLSDLWRMLF